LFGEVMFTTFDNTHPAQHVPFPPTRPFFARARVIERGFFCSVSSGADPGATTNRRPPMPPLLHPLNP
jgi:hypothetical protein